MSAEQKEDLNEMDLELAGSKVTPQRSKEKSSKGKNGNANLFQKKTTPHHQPSTEPTCQCTHKKVNSADPIKGNRGKLILLIWSVTLVILWVIIYAILAYFDVV